MATLPVEKMRELERRFGEIEARMSAGPAADVYVKLASEYSELQPVVAVAQEHGVDMLLELVVGHERSAPPTRACGVGFGDPHVHVERDGSTNA